MNALLGLPMFIRVFQFFFLSLLGVSLSKSAFANETNLSDFSISVDVSSECVFYFMKNSSDTSILIENWGFSDSKERGFLEVRVADENGNIFANSIGGVDGWWNKHALSSDLIKASEIEYFEIGKNVTSAGRTRLNDLFFGLTVDNDMVEPEICKVQVKFSVFVVNTDIVAARSKLSDPDRNSFGAKDLEPARYPDIKTTVSDWVVMPCEKLSLIHWS